MRSASVGSRVLGGRRPSTSTANSSPPKRATVSLGAHRGAQPLGDRDEQLVAGAVAERVVDLLEAVEVEEEHGHAAASARRRRERVLRAGP